MPSPDTLSIKPIRKLAERYCKGESADPFARNCDLCKYTNDLDPETSAEHHEEATTFLKAIKMSGTKMDFVLLDPPYSPRQISECYKQIGLPVTTATTQNARLYREVKDAVDLIMKPGGKVMTLGWSSSGMGKTRDYEIVEILLVCHGGAHNDTICVVEEKR